MAIFWISAAILTLIVCVLLLAATLGRAGSGKQRGQYDEADMLLSPERAFFKGQLVALEKDHKAGLLDAEQYQVAKAELARDVINAEKQAPAREEQGKWGLAHSLIAIIATCAVAGGAYLYLGSPNFDDQPLAPRIAAIENLDVDDAIAKIEAQLQQTPDDIRGWRVLVPVYVRSGQVDKAINAFENIVRIEGENADNLTDLAEALLLKNEGDANANIKQVLEKASSLDPNHVRSRFYLANIALKEGEFDKAEQRWRAVIALAKGDEPWLESAQNGLTAALNKGEVAGPSSDEVKAAGELDEAARVEMIQQMVQGLSDRLYQSGGTVTEWVQLIKARMVMQQFDVAQSDLEKARSAFEDNATAQEQLNAALISEIKILQEELDQ